jgi:ferredoxin--NADP+ reductase
MVDGTGMCGACRVSVGNETKFCCVDGPDFDGHKVDFDLLMSRQRQYLDEEKDAVLVYEQAGEKGGCACQSE